MIDGKRNGIAYVTGPSGLVAGRPTLVFIHGAGGSAQTWTAQLDALDPVANTLALDLPGHGASDPPGRETVPDYAAAVLGLLDALAVPDPVPVGHSMGGAITQQLLLDLPGRFPRAVLVSTGARLKVLPLIFDKLDQDFPGFIGLMGKFAFSPSASEEIKKDNLADTARQDPKIIAGDFRACHAFNVIERLPAIKSRVLIVTAQDDFLTPPKFGEALEQAIPGARRVHLLGSGHMVPIEKAAELNEALRGFLGSEVKGTR